jgi:hypothetical protein
MAGKSAVQFWSTVAQQFGNNTLVFYELYNEPHTGNVTSYMHGDKQTAGMIEMLQAVREHTDTPAIIAGAAGYAYDAASLITLDAELKKLSPATTQVRRPICGFPPCQYCPTTVGATKVSRAPQPRTMCSGTFIRTWGRHRQGRRTSARLASSRFSKP